MQSFSYTFIYLLIQKTLDQFPDGRYEVRNEVSYFFLIHSDSQRFQLIIKLLCLLLMAGCMQVSAAESGVLALGANLSDSQKAEVYAQMGITAEQAASYQTIYITNDMEHQYLDASL